MCVRSCIRWFGRWTVDPSSDLYYRWLAVITLAAMYNLTIIVGRTVLPDLQDSYRAVWISLDYVCDLIYIFDIVVRFRTSEFVDSSTRRPSVKNFGFENLSNIRLILIKLGVSNAYARNAVDTTELPCFIPSTFLEWWSKRKSVKSFASVPLFLW